MRKTLIGVLVTALLSVATPVAAEEITMVCKLKDLTRTHKYSNPLIGQKKVLSRSDGQWKEWARKTKADRGPRKLTIRSRSATLETTTDDGDALVYHWRIVLDFEFITRKEYLWISDNGGIYKEGTSPDKTRTYNWKCKKHEPN